MDGMAGLEFEQRLFRPGLHDVVGTKDAAVVRRRVADQLAPVERLAILAGDGSVARHGEGIARQASVLHGRVELGQRRVGRLSTGGTRAMRASSPAAPALWAPIQSHRRAPEARELSREGGVAAVVLVAVQSLRPSSIRSPLARR
jgi:hypothetical protein